MHLGLVGRTIKRGTRTFVGGTMPEDVPLVTVVSLNTNVRFATNLVMGHISATKQMVITIWDLMGTTIIQVMETKAMDGKVGIQAATIII